MKLVKSETVNNDFGLIGRGITVSGDVVFSDRIHVDGKVVGTIRSEKGTLIIGESGHLEAQLEVGVCVIHGSLHGDLVARSRVEIHRTARVHGDVITPVLVIEEGAMFNGQIKMGQDAGRALGEVPREESDSEGKRKVKGA